MGYDVDNLVVHGHIYLVWDHKAMFGMRMVRDPERERKHFPPDEDRAASVYWSMC
jgi:hypothetical protein